MRSLNGKIKLKSEPLDLIPTVVQSKERDAMQEEREEGEIIDNKKDEKDREGTPKKSAVKRSAEKEGESGTESKSGDVGKEQKSPKGSESGSPKKKRNSYADSPHKLKCPKCPRSFPWISSLNRHMLTHTGKN